MKIDVLTIGKEKDRGLRKLILDYYKRCQPTFSVELGEVKHVRIGGPGEVQNAIRLEGQRLLARVPRGYLVVAMDVKGIAVSSTQLSQRLDALRQRSVPGVAILIGGACGLSEEVLQRSDLRLSLSPLTLPHSLAQLVLAEQLYRAKTIIRGEPYHK